MNKAYLMIVFLLLLLLLGGCVISRRAVNEQESTAQAGYRKISQEEAKRIMEEKEGYIIVDVRTEYEYDLGHIPGAVLIPNESIKDTEPKELPDKEQIILVYCRSGNRSKQASKKLLNMGYTNVYDFGGIIEWTGSIVTGK